MVLYQDLLELRGDVFMDHSILAGQEWWDTICDAIEATDLFVFVLSDASLDSEACQSEVTYALAMKRPFLPLAVGDVRLDDLPIELKRFQVVPYNPDSKDNYKQIVKAIAAAGTAADPPDPRPERPALPESYTNTLPPHHREPGADLRRAGLPVRTAARAHDKPQASDPDPRADRRATGAARPRRQRRRRDRRLPRHRVIAARAGRDEARGDRAR